MLCLAPQSSRGRSPGDPCPGLVCVHDSRGSQYASCSVCYRVLSLQSLIDEVDRLRALLPSGEAR